MSNYYPYFIDRKLRSSEGTLPAHGYWETARKEQIEEGVRLESQAAIAKKGS